ncbi:sulfotransferase family protein [Candidatus Leptofilum sp.]|uniref:sulfotransferase family protein n=1 Tax=Candidatus Leptofilum sp. TaxID=3241576 RepID=UPI003B5BF3B3
MQKLLRKFVTNARILNINQKVRKNPTGFVSLRDFDVTPGDTVSLKTITRNPNISLYALNHFAQEAIFVETPSDVDLSERPFLYQAQYDEAIRLYSMSYKSLFKLAEMVRQPNKQLILIHSVGRCGSTLLNAVFNNLPDVLSLSEPEAFTEIVKRRKPDGRNDDKMARLLDAIIQVQCHPTDQVAPKMYAIKFRSFSTVMIDLLHRVAPQSKHIFLYRNAEDRARSIARAFRTVEAGNEVLDPANLRVRTQFVPLLSQYADRATSGELSKVEFSMLAWLSGMQKYLEMDAAGVPMCAVRYEDMIAEPQHIVKTLFEYCGLPTTPERLALGVKAFERDSQQGSSLARTNLKQDAQNRLTDAHLAEIRQLLAEHPTIKKADFIVPGTIQPN